MVETNPFDEIHETLEDDHDPECLRSVTQEEELCSNPSDGEGTRPTESTNNFTQKEDTSQRMTNPVGRAASKAKQTQASWGCFN
jgi:hypothetical protein